MKICRFLFAENPENFFGIHFHFEKKYVYYILCKLKWERN